MTMTTSRLNAAVDYGIKVGRAERAKAHDGQPGNAGDTTCTEPFNRAAGRELLKEGSNGR